MAKHAGKLGAPPQGLPTLANGPDPLWVGRLLRHTAGTITGFGGYRALDAFASNEV